ncbi:response regulator transcription factor [Dyadobacter chenwenxiniae]|uniref:Response regulator transcription factor n=1 Tax=Dyadobacter chenwenxiniae TaxID=2906456 RepID=A0A9X1PM75_9BACT|nr:response regulator transcription factor [Dyadobacter chenwenxiniae]MCF0062809.1 response regulator transcription factor [Dyadobacter chenwenxiniae]UON85016.1 response regulator transcription factor [Dyadobacter chenwenxiniae]
MQLKILIADDHPIFLTGLKEVIETDEGLKVVTSARNGKEALQQFQAYSNLDVVVLDINMPVMSGLEAAEQLLQIKPDLPVIILTMHKEKAPFMKSLEIGVMGYVLKENAVSDIVHAIYKVMDGNSYLSPEISSYLLKRNAFKTKQENEPDLLGLLTPAENQIIRMIAAYKSSREIADELFISEKTVFNHRMNISKKLNITGKNSLLRFALDHF